MWEVIMIIAASLYIIAYGVEKGKQKYQEWVANGKPLWELTWVAAKAKWMAWRGKAGNTTVEDVNKMTKTLAENMPLNDPSLQDYLVTLSNDRQNISGAAESANTNMINKPSVEPSHAPTMEKLDEMRSRDIAEERPKLSIEPSPPDRNKDSINYNKTYDLFRNPYSYTKKILEAKRKSKKEQPIPLPPKPTAPPANLKVPNSEPKKSWYDKRKERVQRMNDKIRKDATKAKNNWDSKNLWEKGKFVGKTAAVVGATGLALYGAKKAWDAHKRKKANEERMRQLNRQRPQLTATSIEKAQEERARQHQEPDQINEYQEPEVPDWYARADF